jgi:hypothetical protein
LEGRREEGAKGLFINVHAGGRNASVLAALPARDAPAFARGLYLKISAVRDLSERYPDVKVGLKT